MVRRNKVRNVPPFLKNFLIIVSFELRLGSLIFTGLRRVTNRVPSESYLWITNLYDLYKVYGSLLYQWGSCFLDHFPHPTFFLLVINLLSVTPDGFGRMSDTEDVSVIF